MTWKVSEPLPCIVLGIICSVYRIRSRDRKTGDEGTGMRAAPQKLYFYKNKRCEQIKYQHLLNQGSGYRDVSFFLSLSICLRWLVVKVI